MLVLVILSYQNDENKTIPSTVISLCNCCVNTAREPNSMELSKSVTNMVYWNSGAIVIMIDSHHTCAWQSFG